MDMDMQVEEMARTVSSRSSVKEDQPDLQDMSPDNNRISELPDEIIVDILSQLRMKEMVQTTVFSKRLGHVWTSMRNLNFDCDLDGKFKEERQVHVRFVNEAIRRHLGQFIDKFTAAFKLDETCSSDIDSWISFALRKGVQNLKLDLCNQFGNQWDCYTFPTSTETSSCISLTSLQLLGVNISGQVLELLLRNCPNLEFVCVSCSKTLESLKVDGPKLKCLELLRCPDYVSVGLSAPNLVSFKFSGEMLNARLINVPKLVDLSIQGRGSKEIQYTLGVLFSSVVSQLEMLTFDVFTDAKVQKYMMFPKFTKLKYLKLVFTLSSCYSSLGYNALIKASPSLYKITIQIPRIYVPDTIEPIIVQRCQHNIKVVEFDGFQGCVADAEFAIYLIDNAVALEKIVFDTRAPKNEEIYRYWVNGSRTRDHAYARQRAEQLGERLPAGVELIII